MRSLALLVVLFGCSSEDTGVVKPTLGTGAADGVDDVTFIGPLAFAEPVNGAFTRNRQFDGYYLDVRAGAEVKLEITHGGSSTKLDTTLFVYGPADASGGFPADEIAFDNDSGYGKLSKLTTTLAEAGRYAVVVGTKTAKGRGMYRLVPTCLSGECGPIAAIPLGGCPAPFLAAMRTCVAGNHEPYDPLTPRLNAAEQCSDADLLAPIFDATCAAGTEAWCLGSFEAFYTVYAPACTRDMKNEILDDWCVFGVTYHEIAAQPSMTLAGEIRLTGASTLTTLEAAQIVSAVHVSAHTDVTTAAQAFTRVDQGEIFQRQWWDASARRAYTSYEFGSGDNSYGQIFQHGSTTPVANITDGDIYPETCTAKYGAEIRDCTASSDCKTGTTCTGVVDEIHRGTCVNPAADTSPLEGSACTATAACPVDSGLSCAGLSRGPSGLCLPAWQRRSFVSEPQLAIPDNNAAGVAAFVYVYGLATVDMDVWLRLHVTHPRTADLVITLESPAGAVVPVPFTAGVDLDLDLAVRGFSGDESVNGGWKLRVVDKTRLKTGTIDRVELVVGSRWD
ncbi:MAG: proprotein convertase P-domain-containing protein [Kofleriaceae bacterium]